MDYTVMIPVQVTATSPQEAAKLALEDLRDTSIGPWNAEVSHSSGQRVLVQTGEPLDELNQLLKAKGVEPNSTMEAERLMSDGWRAFIFHEMDDEPTEVFSLTDLERTTTDRVLLLAPGEGENEPERPRG